MKMLKNILTATIICVSGTLLMAQTPRITFKADKLYPEGVALDPATGTYYVGSVKTGTIGTVDQQGNYKEFYKDKDLISSFGMKVEPGKNKLWVCLADPDSNYSTHSSPATFRKMARLIAIDLKSAKKIADIDLSKTYNGKHFINDLCFDGKGNIYLTDSFSPVIYKVDAAGKATVFAENELFKSIDIGLNGIVYHPGGYLLVDHNSSGTIIKVPISNPNTASIVKIKTLFPGADGLIIDDQQNLILIQNKGVNKVFKISSVDNWSSAEVKEATGGTDRFAQPSTGVVGAGKVWVLNSRLNELSNPTLVPSKEFSLQLAVFQPVK
ncbi:SMP-30/gluconolactonase/LRE family protein [Mucilaginibacter gynuensis]|uniref:SMP-30/gluconolactonase/LRE family protein n=2 Tax=Mucilaginibacter gynuensis TaxID=1302236 RepID=A0ABP8GCH0_9SPHI